MRVIIYRDNDQRRISRDPDPAGYLLSDPVPAWRWTLVSANGRTAAASSESYQRRDKAIANLELVTGRWMTSTLELITGSWLIHNGVSGVSSDRWPVTFEDRRS